MMKEQKLSKTLSNTIFLIMKVNSGSHPVKRINKIIRTGLHGLVDCIILSVSHSTPYGTIIPIIGKAIEETIGMHSMLFIDGIPLCLLIGNEYFSLNLYKTGSSRVKDKYPEICQSCIFTRICPGIDRFRNGWKENSLVQPVTDTGLDIEAIRSIQKNELGSKPL